MRTPTSIPTITYLCFNFAIHNAIATDHPPSFPVNTTPTAESPASTSLAIHTTWKRARDPRLGAAYQSIPVYRTLGGTNVVTVGLGGKDLGDTEQRLNLTVCEYRWYRLDDTGTEAVCFAYSDECAVCYGCEDGLFGMCDVFCWVSNVLPPFFDQNNG